MKKTNQKIYYDKKTDVLWLNIKSGPLEKYNEISPGVAVELDKNGELLGVEILNASKVLGPKLGFDSSQSPAILHKIHSSKVKLV